LATEIVEHTRASLDHATWASAYAHTRNPNLEFGVFPFASDADKLIDKIKGVSKDCPPQVQALLRKFEPYKGGNLLLFTLNDMCNLSKHALVTFMATATVAGTITGKAFRGPIQFLEPILLDPVKNEIPYMRVLKDTNPEHDPDFKIHPLIQWRENISEEPAIHVLNVMIQEANRIVGEIENECRRIGLVQ
jgi:hypothetical protein